MSELTMADTETWTMRNTAHLNGGKAWFGHRHACNQQPRLSRTDKYFRKDRSVQSTWHVDGRDMPSLEAAVEALNKPPVFEADEMEALRQMCGDWEDVLSVVSHEVLWRLTNKGAVVMDQGLGKPTDLGRNALHAAGLHLEGQTRREDGMTDAEYLAAMRALRHLRITKGSQPTPARTEGGGNG